MRSCSGADLAEKECSRTLYTCRACGSGNVQGLLSYRYLIHDTSTASRVSPLSGFGHGFSRIPRSLAEHGNHKMPRESPMRLDGSRNMSESWFPSTWTPEAQRNILGPSNNKMKTSPQTKAKAAKAFSWLLPASGSLLGSWTVSRWPHLPTCWLRAQNVLQSLLSGGMLRHRLGKQPAYGVSPHTHLKCAVRDDWPALPHPFSSRPPSSAHGDHETVPRSGLCRVGDGTDNLLEIAKILSSIV